MKSILSIERIQIVRFFVVTIHFDRYQASSLTKCISGFTNFFMDLILSIQRDFLLERKLLHALYFINFSKVKIYSKRFVLILINFHSHPIHCYNFLFKFEILNR